MSKIQRKCAWCGKEFTPDRVHKKYHSADCARKAHLSQMTKNNEMVKNNNAPKKRICKYCHHSFTPKYARQVYCCHTCSYEALKEYDRRKYEIVKTNRPAPIKRNSIKKQKQLNRYDDLRIDFLNQTRNRYCPVAKKVFGKYLLATEVHHKAGRVGKLLLDTKKWLAVSRTGHNWIHEHPEEAYKLGFLLHSTHPNS